MRTNTRCCTFDDGGVGKLMFSCNGIAAQNNDIPKFAHSISSAAKLYPNLMAKIHALSFDEITRRSNGLTGSDGTLSQTVSSSDICLTSNPYALIC